jgi:hypothetical protein
MDYLCTRNSASAAIIDFAATHSYRLARSLTRTCSEWEEAAELVACPPGVIRWLEVLLYSLSAIVSSQFYCNRGSFPLLRDGRGQHMRQREIDRQTDTHTHARARARAHHFIPQPCPLYFPLTTIVMFIVISLYCYVHCYSYSSHSEVVLPAVVYYYYY